MPSNAEAITRRWMHFLMQPLHQMLVAQVFNDLKLCGLVFLTAAESVGGNICNVTNKIPFL